MVFTGKGPRLAREVLARRVVAGPSRVAWLEQVHSATVLEAVPGVNGPADALTTDRRGLALCVVTADCVPVLLAAPGRVAAVHAGWRGLAAGVVPTALARFGTGPVSAWIGPAIGVCCYEVGEEVAAEVARASSAAVVRPGPRGRPHIDLAAAAALQLRRHGVREIHRLGLCTRCDDRLRSYRREGAGAGRNLAVIRRG